MPKSFGYKLDIGFATVELFENYLVATIHEGVVFEKSHFKKFHQIFEEHYYKRPFGYISDRKNDYTVDPTCYKDDAIYFENLVGIATLCYSEQSMENARFAAQFFDYPHEAFFSLKECVSYIEDLLEKSKK